MRTGGIKDTKPESKTSLTEKEENELLAASNNKKVKDNDQT